MSEVRQPRRAPRVFTIPAGAPFLETLADALLDGTLVEGFSREIGPLGLAAATIYVPTRRSARAFAATLATRLSGGVGVLPHHAAHLPMREKPGGVGQLTHLGSATTAALLPRIVPLGALDDTELLFDDPGLDAGFAADLPDAIGPIARRMVLTRLILRWGEAVRHAIVAVEPDGRRVSKAEEPLLVATSPADAWHLSGELASLIDELAIEGVAWHRVEPLGTDAFDRYWRITLDFLDVAISAYPAILAERGEVDPATRQIALVDAEVARLAASGSKGPVIVAGSTGSNAATARLIAAVARLPQGAVVLPGLDQGLDERAWGLVGMGEDGGPSAGHPQASLHRLIGAIGIDREAVLSLGTVPSDLTRRAQLVSEALRPAETTELWQGLGLDAATALAGVTLIEAADEAEEAKAIAVTLREVLEGPGSAALVTPDRELARRVREELTRWGVEIEESSGEPLGQTPAGSFARLLLDATLAAMAPVEVLALLHHPHVSLGRTRGSVIRLTRRLELGVLRGTVAIDALGRPDELVANAKARRDDPHAPQPLRNLSDTDLDDLAAFLGDLLAALAPLRDLPREATLPAWLDAHERALAALARDEAGEVSLVGADYEALGALLAELDGAADPAIALDGPGYGAFFDRLAAETPVRGPNRSHPRLKILGLLEARLLTADRLVLGGLDEAIWPPAARQDPFLNRPMRASLSLAPPERRIGRTAHDFEMAMGGRAVVVTRARKRGGSPTVPSRFLQRLDAVAGPALDACRARGQVYLEAACALDKPIAQRLIARPSPKPPVDVRPKRLSVTRIETLRRDPYAIHAEFILKLVPLDGLALPMGMREYGTAFHGVIHDFARRPGAGAEAFFALLRDAFADALQDPGFRAFQWPRVESWARGFLAWEAGRREGVAHVAVEERGRLEIPLHDGSIFTLSANADRIEVDQAGLATVVDFKTGAAPTIREVKAGFAPQLTLEADMVARGAFAGLGPVARVAAAAYVKFGADDVAKVIDLDWKGEPPFAAVVAQHREELIGLLNSFRSAETGYLARPFPKYASRFATYDHLARVKEWSATGGVEEAGGAG